jgi:predicted DNA-binding protein (MmcQ/YjbR family)
MVRHAIIAAVKRPTRAEGIHARLRKICRALPNAREIESFGRPTFRAGAKTFAVLEEYRSEPCLSLKVSRADQKRLLQDPRFARTPLVAHLGWVSLSLEGPLDWGEIEELIASSYREVTAKRSIAALDRGA